jgi:hypothetical protein
MKKFFCERNWTIQQQISIILRLKELIEKTNEKLQNALKYFNFLKEKDEEIYLKGIQQEQEEEIEKIEEQIHPLSTEEINLDFVLLIFENYINTKWTRDAMTRTTTLNQKITSLQENISTTKAKIIPKTPKSIVTQQNEEEENQFLIEIFSFQEELLQTQFELFINRFECKKSKQNLARTEAGINFFKQQQVQQQQKHKKHHQQYHQQQQQQQQEKQQEKQQEQDQIDERSLPQQVDKLSTINLKEYIDPIVYDQVISTQHLAQRGFSQRICQSNRLRLDTLLKRLATTFDPSDTEGKISEVLYGASLDHNEICEIHSVKNKQLIERQWYQIAMVVYGFAKLFRLVRLKKAAKKRKQKANEIYFQEILPIQKYSLIAKSLINQEEDQPITWLLEDEDSLQTDTTTTTGTSTSNKSSTMGSGTSSSILGRTKSNPLKQRHLRQFAHRLSYEFEENEWVKGIAGRIGLGLATFQPMHAVLGPLFDTDGQVSNFATQLELHSAMLERRPPKPLGLELISATDDIIKVQWKPLADESIMYIAEIKEWHIDSRFDTKQFGYHENGPPSAFGLDSNSKGNASPFTFENKLSRNLRGKMTSGTTTTTSSIPTTTPTSMNSMRTTMYSKSIGWEQKLCDILTTSDKTVCCFYKLKKNQMYCIRVRGAFTKTKVGPPSDPLFIQL